jgi:hypothetical protein
MKQTVVISSPTCFGYCVAITRELHCAWLKLRMSLYVEIVQIVQRQGLAVIFHVVRFSLHVYTQTSYQSTHHRLLQTKPD